MTRTRPELVNLYRTSVPQTGRYSRLRLDKNENTIGFPPAVIRKMVAGIGPHFIAAYPEPGVLYRKIAKSHGLKVENVLITAGSELAIRYLFEAYLDRGDKIIFCNPSFAMFEVYAKLCGAKLVQIPCGPNLQFDVKDIARNLSSRVKIVAIANPNNPTGTVVSEKDLRWIIAQAARHDTLVLVDEAYYHFYGKTMLDHFHKYKNLVITRTFSKAAGMASIRLGYALAHTSVIAEIRKLQPIDHASAFALKLGEYVVDHPELIRHYVKEVSAGKAYLMTEAARLGISVPTSYGNFLLLDLGAKRELFLTLAEKMKILLGTHVRLPFSNNYVRVTVGPKKQMKILVAALKAAMH